MKNSRYFLTLVLGLFVVFEISQTQAGTEVPVLIWGGDLPALKSHLVNPFEKTSQEDFKEIVTKIEGGSLDPLVFFVMDDLCIEDLIKNKSTLAPLMDVDSLIYHPRVDAPVSVLEQLPFYNCTNEKELETISDVGLVLRYLPNLNPMPQSFNLSKDYRPNIVTALTGKFCRYSRSERIKRAVGDEPTPAPASTAFIFKGPRILFWASEPPTLNVTTDTNMTETFKNVSESGEGTKESPLQLNFEYTVNDDKGPYTVNVLIQFPEQSLGYYTPEVLYKRDEKNITLSANTDLSFPFNFSYHCTQNITFRDSSQIAFDLKDFQVQIDADDFGDAYDCVGFMTIPIWAGIFVTTILAIIMIWGLTMIMDIRTMDRFDDPKGKTITISASVE